MAETLSKLAELVGDSVECSDIFVPYAEHYPLMLQDFNNY